MKNMIYPLLVLTMLIFSLQIKPLNALGIDVDNSGTASVLDCLRIQQYLLNYELPESNSPDVDGNGVVTSKDVLLCQLGLLGLMPYSLQELDSVDIGSTIELNIQNFDRITSMYLDSQEIDITSSINLPCSEEALTLSKHIIELKFEYNGLFLVAPRIEISTSGQATDACLDQLEAENSSTLPSACDSDVIHVVDRFGDFTGSTSNAPSGEGASCGEGAASQEVVHFFSINQDAILCLSTSGSSYDTVLHVRRRCAA